MKLVDDVVTGRRAAAVLAILCSAVFMASLDMFIVNVALDSIGHDDAAASLADLSWILNGYTIVYGALLVPAGRLADRFGKRAAFVVGLAVFTLASLACALSPGLPALVACRCLQAAGAAVLTPASLGLVLTTLPERSRARSVRIWASSGALAAAAGPMVGGLLIESSWRWIFLLNLPIGVAAIVMTLRLVPRVTATPEGRWPDLLGGGLLIVALGALALILVDGATMPRALVAIATTLGFAWQSRRHPSPIIDPALLHHRVFVWSNLSVLLLAIAFAMELLSVVLFLQHGWGWSALKTGLAIAPGPCMVPIFAMVGQRLSRRIPIGVIAALGGAFLALAPAVLALSVGSAHVYLDLLPGWLLAGIGTGLAFPTAIASGTSELPPHQASTGSAVINMSRQLGTVVGISLLVLVLEGGGSFQRGWWLAAGVALAGAFTAFGIRPLAPRSVVAARVTLAAD